MLIFRKVLPRCLCAIAIPAVVSALLFCGGAAAAGAKDVYNFYQREPVSLDKPSAPEPAPVKPITVDAKNITADRGTSDLWRSSIWEAFPAEQLREPGADPVSEAYEQSGWKPLFIDSHFRINAQGKTVLDRLNALESEAIDPKPYRLDDLAAGIEKLDRADATLKAADPEMKDTRADALSAPSHVASPGSGQPGAEQAPAPAQNSEELLSKYREAFHAAAAVDSRLASAFIRYAKEMEPSRPGEDTVKALSGEIPLSRFLKEIRPAGYDALVSAYDRYKKLAASGQQAGLVSAKLHPGESGNNARNLQKRLQIEGYYSGHLTGVYDSETQRAVKEYQTAHAVDPDGVVGRRTQEWINMPLQEKADMIAYSMKALRNSPLRTQQRYLRINIPQFMLEYHRDGKIAETHRVIVGQATGKKVKFRGRMVGENQTPTLTSTIEQVILNPRWYVSDRISLELNAEAKSDPEYFTRHGYVQMASLYPWGQPRIFQRPGPKNALGRVKFEFPNPYAVYLHDTPKKFLFQRTRRDFSHGCIRVDKALGLAETLLKDDSSAYAEKMETVLQGDHQTFVKLSQPVPIGIEYVPVTADDKGRVVFVGDPYGLLKEDAAPKQKLAEGKNPEKGIRPPAPDPNLRSRSNLSRREEQ